MSVSLQRKMKLRHPKAIYPHDFPQRPGVGGLEVKGVFSDFSKGCGGGQGAAAAVHPAVPGNVGGESTSYREHLTKAVSGNRGISL